MARAAFQVEKFRHDVKRVFHAGVEAAGVDVGGDGVGREALFDGAGGLFEFERGAAVADVEKHATFAGFV